MDNVKESNDLLRQFILFSTGYHLSNDEITLLKVKINKDIKKVVSIKDNANYLEVKEYYEDVKSQASKVKPS